MAHSVPALMREMSLADKIGQLNLLSAGEGPETGSPAVQNIRARVERGELGAIFGTKSVRSVRAWQEIAVGASPHGIPLFFAEDVIHGHRTVFALPIALACAFNADLWQRLAQIAAAEASAEGINQVYAPVVDIARDPRWGRMAESPGEDPFLASRYAEATVRGLEGADARAQGTVVACLKHFLAYGAAAGGRDYDNASLAPEEAIGVYAEPFRAGIAAGAGSVMASFNALNKVPMHAHATLIDGWLRGTAGFGGLVVADYTGVAELVRHGLGGDDCAAARALLAGVDMDMVGETYLACLPRLAEDGIDAPEAGLSVAAEAIVAAIERACERVLSLKERLGLFDDPFRYCDEGRAASQALAPRHREAARAAIPESVVLLKNEGALPLAPGARVALIGAMADDRSNMLGTWAVSGDPAKAITLREGLAACHGGPITCARGADLVDDPVLAERLNVHGETVTFDGRDADEMREEAMALAGEADVVVAVVGEAKEHSGESSSVTDLTLPAAQRRLVEALATCGKPLVLVVLTGRALALEAEAARANAVLYAFFQGTEAGNGIADVLTGAAEPSGRLSVTLPARTGQVPVHHAAEPTGRPYPGQFQKFTTGYLDLPDTTPPATGLFPFGFGLSYTRFAYGAPTVERERLAGPHDVALVTVTVENTGTRSGSDVVLLFAHDPVARITRPMRELKGFQKVTLDPGERRDVSFRLRQGDLSYPLGESLGTVKWVFDPGTFILSVGPNARDTESVRIEWDA